MDLAAAQSVRDTILSTPVEDLDPSDGYRFRDDTIHLVFERLRREDPVHWSTKTRFGSFWSVTRYKDIMAVDSNHRVFSSDAFAGGSVTLSPRKPEEILPSFIEMDPPRHDEQRKAVSPIVAPHYLAKFEELIRSRVIDVVESLPVGEPFDWVQRVSIDLTTKMLATLFDFPFEERHLLTWWSDIATGHPKDAGPVESWEMRQEELAKCLACFTGLWNERVNDPPRPDLISMLAHSPATRNMDEKEFLGNLLLLIVGGNDTTRNSMSGGLLALNRFPGEYDKLRARPELIPSMVSEIIRWQTPLAFMRRTAVEDTELGGKHIRKGDTVVMWYISGNRDETMIERPHDFIIDRPNPRQHVAFGFGIHRCVGNRLAELQLRILWEELLARHPRIQVIGEPERTLSNFVHGFTRMTALIPA